MDLHVHTTYSDGSCEPVAVIEKAIEVGIKHLGIADHYGNLERYSIASAARLNEYITELKRLKQLCQSKLHLWLGLETSILDGLPYWQLNQLDFVLFEDIETDPRLDYFISQVKPHLRIPVGIAHTQIIFLENSFLRLEKEKIFIELNTHYPDRYRSNWARSTWQKLAATDIRISVASDAHDTNRVGDTADALKFIKETNLPLTFWLP